MAPTDKGEPKPNGAKDKDEKGKKKPKGVKIGKQDTIDQDDIEEEYGLSYALFKAFPDLNDLLKEAIAENWPPSTFQVELRQTEWFKKHSDVWRENTALSFSDPATFEERLGTVSAKVGNLAASVGVTLGQKALDRLAKRALLFGMSDDELRNWLGNHVKPSAEGNYTGELASIEEEVRATALKNGINLNSQQIQKWMQAIVRGDASTEQYLTGIRNMAAQAFPLYGDQIKGGMDLADVANPYLNSMANLLELNPESITLDDPTVRRALAGTRDQKGKLVPTNIAEFEDTLRQDKRWLYTRQAKDQARGYAASIAKMWGF